MDKLPELSVDLIAKLDELNPPRCPAIGESERAIWMYTGRRQLVDELLQHVERDDDMEELNESL